MRLHWGPSEDPLPARAAAAQGDAARRLVARVDASSAGRWASWRFERWVVVTGEELPWVDGVIYLGGLPGAPRLLVPVHRRPLLPPDLVAAAVASLVGGCSGAVALIPDGTAAEVAVLPLHRR